MGGKRDIVFVVQRPELCICAKFFVFDGLDSYRFCIFKAGIEDLAEIMKLFFFLFRTSIQQSGGFNSGIFVIVLVDGI